MLTTLVDNFPKISLKDQRFRKAYSEFEVGKITEDEFEKVADDVTHDTIKTFLDLGLDLITDGQIRWDDPLSYIAKKLEGVNIGGLLRWFDNNVYFRQPVIKAPLKRKEPLVLKDWVKAQRWAGQTPVKAVLTGPYTFFKLSLYEVEGNEKKKKEVAFSLAEVVKDEVKELKEAGAKFIQIEEPAILFHPEDFSFFSDLILKVLEGVGKEKGGDTRISISIYTFFSDASRVWNKLLDIPVEILGLDFISGGNGNKNFELIKDFPKDKILGYGCIDARNTLLETPDEVAGRIERISKYVDLERIHVSPNCGLEFLPWERAKEKLKVLVEGAKLLR